MKKIRILAIILAILGSLLIISFGVYSHFISPIDKNSKADIEVVIPSGMSTTNIGKTLKNKDLIRNEFIFKVYLKINNISNLKASTYLFQKNMNLEEIVKSLMDGSNYNPNLVRITFKEGKTINDYASIIEEKTNISKDEFLNKVNDIEFLNILINDYWFLTNDILNQDIYYKLEGYLFPDTYEFDKEGLTSEIIIRTLLDEQDKKLSIYKETLTNKNIHSILTLASITELEGVKLEDRKNIIGVFYNRLNRGMSLGSDVTTYYAFKEKMDSDLTSEMFNTYNPYNTRSSLMAGKLPIGPICNPSINSIDATINYTANDYLYFVADKKRNVYFTKSEKEHINKVQEIKENGDWIW